MSGIGYQEARKRLQVVRRCELRGDPQVLMNALYALMAERMFANIPAQPGIRAMQALRSGRA